MWGVKRFASLTSFQKVISSLGSKVLKLLRGIILWLFWPNCNFSVQLFVFRTRNISEWEKYLLSVFYEWNVFRYCPSLEDVVLSSTVRSSIRNSLRNFQISFGWKVWVASSWPAEISREKANRLYPASCVAKPVLQQQFVNLRGMCTI